MDQFPLGIKPFFLQEEYDKNNWAWQNKPETFKVPIPKNTCFELFVNGDGFEAAYPNDFPDKYKKTTENIQWLIKKAIENKLRFRPMGSGWSLSKVAVTNGGIINTKKMCLVARLGERMVAPQYLASGGSADNLVFTQCGNTVVSINEFLEAKGKSLRASGGSNGQTIIGALSTGTHGAAYQFGALSEFVMGLHVVVGPDRHVWLEPKSRPVTTEAFRKEKLGITESIIDDDLFYSALVSFGSFGFIHGVLIEVEPKFLLQQELTDVPYNDALIKAITQYDFSGILPYLVKKDQNDPNRAKDDEYQKRARELHKDINAFNKQLYHFELAINQYDFNIKDSVKDQVKLRMMYKLPYVNDNYSHDDGRKKNYSYGDDLPGLIASALNGILNVSKAAAAKLIPVAVNNLFKTAYDRPASATGTVGETFKNSIFKGRIFSAGFSIDRKDVPRLVEIIIDMVKAKGIPFGGAMAMRFVKGTKATLGWTRFENTCVLELDGVDAEINHDFLTAMADRLQAEGIKYGTHWGKTNTFLNKERVQYMYGDRINKWIGHRQQLMTPQTMEVFNNWFIQNCGLDKTLPQAPMS